MSLPHAPRPVAAPPRADGPPAPPLRLAVVDMSGTSIVERGLQDAAFAHALETHGLAADAPAHADAVRVFATAIPIALIIGPVVPREYVMPAAILVLGLLTVVYTYRGGMKAVVWTELVQAGVYVLGGVSAIVSPVMRSITS